jgi:hypothetical protein
LVEMTFLRLGAMAAQREGAGRRRTGEPKQAEEERGSRSKRNSGARIVKAPSAWSNLIRDYRLLPFSLRRYPPSVQ